MWVWSLGCGRGCESGLMTHTKPTSMVWIGGFGPWVSMGLGSLMWLLNPRKYHNYHDRGGRLPHCQCLASFAKSASPCTTCIHTHMPPCALAHVPQDICALFIPLAFLFAAVALVNASSILVLPLIGHQCQDMIIERGSSPSESPERKLGAWQNTQREIKARG